MSKRPIEEISTLPAFFGVLMLPCAEPASTFSFAYIEYNKLTDEHRRALCASCPSSRENDKIPGCYDLQGDEEEFFGWKVCNSKKEFAKLTVSAHFSFTVAYFDE